MSGADRKYEEKVLRGWEEVYKRGQLTLWVLLALHDSSKRMEEVKRWLKDITDNTITAEDRSLYRVLQRFYTAELVTYTSQSSERGPDQKLYTLSPLGKRVLARFIDRNIKLFTEPEVQGLLLEASQGNAPAISSK